MVDAFLGLKAKRQATFDFLRGDSKTGRKGRKLPVDAYYPELSLVVEYHERQHTEAVKHFDKPDRLTVSGVNRREQRQIYDSRRKEIMPKHGITLVIIDYCEFELSGKKLKRTQKDFSVIEARFAQWKKQV